jgi:hypothetical protein
MVRTSSSADRLRAWRNTSAKGSTKLVLERLDPAEVEWSQLDSLSDRNVFQTREWVEFVEATQAAEPVVARVLDGGRTVAFFTGLLARRFGVRILGSPFQGWATGYLGFNRLEEISNRDAVAALVDFAFGPLGCLHLEFRDRPLAGTDVDGCSDPETSAAGSVGEVRLEVFASDDKDFGGSSRAEFVSRASRSSSCTPPSTRRPSGSA